MLGAVNSSLDVSSLNDIQAEWQTCLHGKQDGVFVAERVSIPAAVLVSPAKVVTLHGHDGTLSFINYAGLTLCPVSFSNRFIAQPVPESTVRAPTHPYPQVRQADTFFLEFVVDLCLLLSPGKAN